MRGHPTEQPTRRGGLARWSARLLVLTGTVLLTWCALALVEAEMSQRTGRQFLETVPTLIVPPSTGAEAALADVPPPAPPLRTGDAVAELTIPRVQLSAVVLHGSDDRTLRRGPGHLENTALPGEPGNMVIAGHRDSFFRPLRGVQVGDEVFVDAPHGRFRYRVTSLRVVSPHDMSVVEPTDGVTLTLITCFPFWVFGSAPDRFIVRAELVGDADQSPPATRAATPQPQLAVPAARALTRETPAVAPAPVADDDTLIRAALERFRMAHNAYLFRTNEMPPGGPLRFDACNVTIAGESAEASCQSVAEDAASKPPLWNAALRRTDGGWAITSIYSE